MTCYALVVIESKCSTDPLVKSTKYNGPLYCILTQYSEVNIKIRVWKKMCINYTSMHNKVHFRVKKRVHFTQHTLYIELYVHQRKPLTHLRRTDSANRHHSPFPRLLTNTLLRQLYNCTPSISFYTQLYSSGFFIETKYFAFVLQSALLYLNSTFMKSWCQCKRTGPAGLGRTIEDEDTVRSPIAALPIDPRKL